MARKWIEYAERDLDFARFGLQDEDHASGAAFHAQQAVEKALKAMCVLVQVAFPKTHDIRALLRLIAGFAPQFVAAWEHVAAVTGYAVESRYPETLPPYSPTQPQQPNWRPNWWPRSGRGSPTTCRLSRRSSPPATPPKSSHTMTYPPAAASPPSAVPRTARLASASPQ